MIDPRIAQVVEDVVGEGVELTEHTRAADVPGWDSLAHINIMFALESEFGVSFTDDQLTAFADVGELQRFLLSAEAVE